MKALIKTTNTFRAKKVEGRDPKNFWRLRQIGAPTFVPDRCPLDFIKAFDKVCYWKLFPKLLDDNINVSVVRLVVFWYSNQEACIRWHDKISSSFTLGNGTRQGQGREELCHLVLLDMSEIRWLILLA